MGKGIMFMIFVGIAILLVGGVMFPNDSAMWLASTTRDYTIVRGIILVLLAGLLVTHPPRNVYFRAIVGSIAVGLGAWSLDATYFNHMQLLDSLSILGASIAMGITALELEPEEMLEKAEAKRRALTV